MPSRAVVILANDKVHDWLAACLASLRTVSPQIPCLILPFDSQLVRTEKLAARYGARIVQSLLTVMRNRGGKYGLAAICNGGGGSTAMIIENLQTK